MSYKCFFDANLRCLRHLNGFTQLRTCALNKNVSLDLECAGVGTDTIEHRSNETTPKI